MKGRLTELKRQVELKICFFIPSLFVVLLSACGGASVVVDSSFPEPLVSALPIKMGVYFSDEFRGFTHEEEAEGQGKYSISTGTSQVALFNQIFNSYFRDTVQLKSIDEAVELASIDGVIAPEIEELQFAIPSQTKNNIFEVWIKYKLTLYQPDGTVIVDWPISAYGKTPTAFMQSSEAALEQAAIVALRDAGANFALSFDKQAAVKEWLETRL